MSREYVLSDAVFNEAQTEMQRGNYWMAYNSASYFLGEGDVYFFNSEQEAKAFAGDNISEYDDYRVMYASCIADLLHQLP